MEDSQVKDLTIIRYPNDLLGRKTIPVEKITREIFDLVEAMKETMLKNDGVGLAANQVGMTQRLFVLNTTPYDEKPTPIAVINPEIIDHEGSEIDEEGCLSFPELRIDIERPKKIRLQMQTLYNEKVILEIQDFLARAVCHEIDHLDGILFIERTVEKDRDKVKRYLEERAGHKTE